MKPTVTAIKYAVSCLPRSHPEARHFTITVEYRGGDQWAVCRYAETADADGNWNYEPSPSNRPEDYLAAHRFTLADALELARTLAPGLTVNNFTVQDAIDENYGDK